MMDSRKNTSSKAETTSKPVLKQKSRSVDSGLGKTRIGKAAKGKSGAQADIDKHYQEILDWFARNNPFAKSELHYKNAYELLVAVILSAQCTDKRVNMVTPALLARFPDPLSMSRSDQEEIYSYIKSISYPNNKAAHLLGMAKMLQSDFGGQVPDTVEDLMRLPGVGRKTANVIASVIFDKPAMAVDTHVFRVSARLGLTHDAKTPLEAEKQLVSHIPENILGKAHHWLILHGRYVCTARKPHCEECGLSELCPYFQADRDGDASLPADAKETASSRPLASLEKEPARMKKPVSRKEPVSLKKSVSSRKLASAKGKSASSKGNSKK